MFEHMDKKVKEDWVEALRSGQYEQKRGNLMTQQLYSGATEYCCLGVLCDAVLEIGHYTDNDNNEEEMFDTLDWFQSQDENYLQNPEEAYESSSSLPVMLRQHLGLSQEEVSALIHLNDGVQCDDNPTGRQHTFSEIANILSDGYLTIKGDNNDV